MSEVYQMMLDSDGTEELDSALGLMHDTMQFALCKGDTWTAKVMHWITNDVAHYPIKEGQDIMARFEEWENTVLEIRYTGAIENNTIIKSVYSLLQHCQPQLAMARDEVQGDMCNLDKYLAAIRRQVEMIAEFELTKKPSPKKQGEKRTTGNDRRKPRKDEDKSEGEAEDKKLNTKKDKRCFMYMQGICSKGKDCPFKHDPKSKEQLVMMVEKRVQEALEGLQVKPEGAIEPTSEGAREDSVNDDTHTC